VYTLDNPLKYTDPDGEFFFTAAVGALIFMLCTYDYAQAPTHENDISELTVGERAFQHGVAIALTGLTIYTINSIAGVGAESVSTAVADATATEAATAAAENTDEKLHGAANPAVKKAIEKGNKEHQDFSRKAAEKGWQVNPTVTDPTTGEKGRPDAITPSGHPVELEPKSPSGKKKGKEQMKKYERATQKRGRVIYYEP
jgi:hypothetical protein